MTEMTWMQLAFWACLGWALMGVAFVVGAWWASRGRIDDYVPPLVYPLLLDVPSAGDEVQR